MATAVLTNGTSRLEIDTDDCDTDVLSELIDLFRESLNIPADANVAVNGEPVEDLDAYSVQDGDEISATKTSGSKG